MGKHFRYMNSDQEAEFRSRIIEVCQGTRCMICELPFVEGDDIRGITGKSHNRMHNCCWFIRDGSCAHIHPEHKKPAYQHFDTKQR